MPPLVRRTFINQERLIGTADYGTEYRFWHVMEGERFVPVRRAQGAQLLEREDHDRIPPGVISRVAVELELPAGTAVLLLVRRPKAVSLPKRERRAFWLTRDGRLVTTKPTPRTAAPRAERLPVQQRAALARNLVQLLKSEPRTPVPGSS